jgi:hypothetical protein
MPELERSAAIGQLTRAFQEALGRADFDRLGELAQALPRQLHQLAARDPWSRAELLALRQLRAAHDGAAGACNTELHTLGARLAEMRNNKDGWAAYALNSQLDNAGHQE